MGVKVVVRDGETVEEALRRFWELVRRFGPPGTNVKWPKWHKNPLRYYLKPSERRRRDRLRDEFETYLGECAPGTWSRWSGGGASGARPTSGAGRCWPSTRPAEAHARGLAVVPKASTP